MGSFLNVIILVDVWKMISEPYKPISDKMDLAETFQIFTFGWGYAWRVKSPKGEYFEKVMNERILVYYGNAVVTRHYNVSRHTWVGCQEWNVVALQENLMESTQVATLGEVCPRPRALLSRCGICSPCRQGFWLICCRMHIYSLDTHKSGREK